LSESSYPPRPDLLSVEALPPQPQQERSRRTRAALLTAALDLFAQYGYELTSISEIAARAGVGAGTLYQHFRSKRQLLLVLMNNLLEELEALNLELGATAIRELFWSRPCAKGSRLTASTGVRTGPGVKRC
jgi:AcrR family transcriptional regulator